MDANLVDRLSALFPLQRQRLGLMHIPPLPQSVLQIATIIVRQD